MKLPAYHPPLTRRASVAVGLSPPLVLLAFVLIVARLIDTDIGFAVFGACALWVVAEMHDARLIVDGYNASYVDAHLARRSTEALRALAEAGHTDPATRDFVQRYLGDGRRLRTDRPALR